MKCEGFEDEVNMAIEDIEKIVDIARKEYSVSGFLGVVHSAKLIENILKKQIPQSPNYDENGSVEYPENWLECPGCGEVIPEYIAENETECYCLFCGQKLKWENEF